MRVQKRPDHSFKTFFKRTIAAQTHMLTAFMAIVGLSILLPIASKSGPLHFWGTLAFGVTAVLVFATSGIYHFLCDGYCASPRLTELMEKLDQGAIYLFIAGTYTPFLINAIKSPWQEILMVFIWAIALIGIFYTLFRLRLPLWAQSRVAYTSVFLIMGWALMVRMGEVWQNLDLKAIGLLFGGAWAYSIGAVVYIIKKPRLFVGVFGFHELWHIFVSLGFAFHFAMILNFYT